jgi:YgiT-type zinc finger domain-containing protein
MRPKLTKCPTCDSTKLKLVRSDYTLKLPNRVVVVPKLDRYECPNCGEVLFDYDGIKRLEEARLPRRKLPKSA